MATQPPKLSGKAVAALTKLNGEVVGIQNDDPSGQPVAKIHVVMSNQDGAVMAEGDALVRLPTEDLPRLESR